MVNLCTVNVYLSGTYDSLLTETFETQSVCVFSDIAKGTFDPIALRKAKTLWSFGHSECNRVNLLLASMDDLATATEIYSQNKEFAHREIISFQSRLPMVVVVESLFYVHGKHLRSRRDGQLT